MIRRPTGSTRTDTLFPYTTLFRSLRFVLEPAKLAPCLPRWPRGEQPAPGERYPAEISVSDRGFGLSGTKIHREEPGPSELRSPLVQHEVKRAGVRSEEHTSELQSLMRISYAVFCLKKKHIQP